MKKRLTAEQYKYYTNIPKGITYDFSLGDKEERKIDVMVFDDLKGLKAKRKREEFKSDKEYNCYLLTLYEYAKRNYLGID